MVSAMAVAAVLAACAARPDDPEARAEYDARNDPFEPLNRAIFEVNRGLDTLFLRPVAEGYRAIVPKFGRQRVDDFLSNLFAPITFIHDILQGNIEQATRTFGRFGLNSTFGVLGLMDVAEPMGLPKHMEDAGETLGVWGVGEGPYMVLPLFGPSTVRDSVGMVADAFADPFAIWNLHRMAATYGRDGGFALDKREQYLDQLDDIERTSLDYYASIRSLYRQRRAHEVEASKAAAPTK